MTTKPIDFRTFLVLESTLLKRLRKAWRPVAAAYHARITEAIKQGNYAAAYETARHLDLSHIGAKNREFVKYLTLACVNFGAKVVTGNRDTVVGAGNHEALLNKTTDSLIYAIENTLMMEMVSSALRLIALNDPSRLALKLEPDEYVNDFVSFSRDGDKLLQLIASQHTSRMSTWGFVAEAEVLDVTQYRVTAVLDGRTSDFCRMMNGHIFEVADARRTVNQVLSLDNPEDIKAVQPWPKQNKAAIAEFKGMSADDLVARNLHIPPYHPMCRTLLTVVKNPPRLQKPEALAQEVNNQAPVMEPYIATMETFEEMGITVTDDMVKHWNDYMGVNPVEVYSKLSGFDQAAILSGAIDGNYRKLVVDEKGNIKVSTQQDVGDGTAKMNLVFDPYNSNLYQNYLTVAYAASPEVAAYLTSLYTGMLDVAQAIEAETLHVASSGASSAKMYAQAGFLPSSVDWFKMKDDLLARIGSGDLSYLAEQMEVDQFQTVLDVLNSKDESGFYALNSLPITVGPYSLSEVLFKDLEVELSLDTSDPTTVAAAKEAFK